MSSSAAGPDTRSGSRSGRVLNQIHQPWLRAAVRRRVPGRAVTDTLAILVVGPAVLNTLRRASRKASYGVERTFDDMIGR